MQQMKSGWETYTVSGDTDTVKKGLSFSAAAALVYSFGQSRMYDLGFFFTFCYEDKPLSNRTWHQLFYLASISVAHWLFQSFIKY